MVATSAGAPPARLTVDTDCIQEPKRGVSGRSTQRREREIREAREEHKDAAIDAMKETSDPLILQQARKSATWGILERLMN